MYTLIAYSANNLGDDLFLKVLCERYPEQQFQLIATNETSASVHWPANLQVHTLHINSLQHCCKKVCQLFSLPDLVLLHRTRRITRGAKANILISGSYFMQPRFWRSALRTLQAQLTMHRRPFFILGVNFGPYKSGRYRAAHRRLFAQAEDVCFRDSASHALFEELENTRHAPDLVFTLHNPQSPAFTAPEPHIIISVMSFANSRPMQRFAQQYDAWIESLALAALRRGCRVTLMSFCAQEGDLGACESLRERLGAHGVQPDLYAYSGDMDEALELLQNSSHIVATRFHCTILGLLLGKPTLPLLYSDKTKNQLADIGYPLPTVNLRQPRRQDAGEALQDLLRVGAFEVDTARHRAQAMFAALDCFISTE